MYEAIKYKEIIDVKVGDLVIVSIKKQKKHIDGEIIFMNESFITIKMKDYKESINMSDFTSGAAEIRKVS